MSTELDRSCKACKTHIRIVGNKVVSLSAGSGGNVCPDCAKILNINPQGRWP